MNGPIMRKLIFKDLYLVRVFIVGSILGGLVSLTIACTTGIVGFAIGGLTFISSVIISGVFCTMFLVLQERKDKARLFALSLPISGRQYAQAKLIAVVTAFLIPWLVLTGSAALAIVCLPWMPGGLLPYLLVLMGFFLALLCLFAAAIVTTESEGWSGVAIVVLNLSISFFMMYIGNKTSIGVNAKSAVAVWSPEVFGLIAFEAALTVLAFALIFFFQPRKRDYV
jgi:ABC-2 type transport system permease protein